LGILIAATYISPKSLDIPENVVNSAISCHSFNFFSLQHNGLPIINPIIKLANTALSSALSQNTPIMNAIATGGATNEETD
jgi:hypothetical protein